MTCPGCGAALVTVRRRAYRTGHAKPLGWVRIHPAKPDTLQAWCEACHKLWDVPNMKIILFRQRRRSGMDGNGVAWEPKIGDRVGFLDGSGGEGTVSYVPDDPTQWLSIIWDMGAVDNWAMQDLRFVGRASDES